MATISVRIGDTVRFMNETGGGRVIAILSKDMVSVETQDGFEIPTYIKNLVVIPQSDTQNPKPKTIGLGDYETGGALDRESGFSRNTRSAKPETNSLSHSPLVPKSPSLLLSQSNSPIVPKSNSPLSFFAALPDNPANPPEGKILLYLVNDCNFTLIYHFATKMAGQYTTVDAGILEPNTKVELEYVDPKKMGELPDYCFQLLYFTKRSTQLEEPVQKEIRISPVKFFKASSFVKNQYFNTPALLIKLADHPLKAELEKLSDKDFQQISLTKEPKKSASTELPKTDLIEIDLHIHNLIDTTVGLSNADMLKLQLDTFRKEMDKAIASGAKKIVFIHGVGDGVLKNEIRRELARKYSKYPFQDASFREYGFGATLAYLRK